MSTLPGRVVLVSALLLSTFFAAVTPARDAQPPVPKTASELEAARLLEQALVEESQGSTEHRQALLGESLRLAPKFAPAHWVAGQLQYEGKWQAVAEVQQQAAKDRRLTEYRNQRNAAVATDVEAQAALAAWCRKNKLDAEARYHWRKILELDPQHAEALKELHMQYYEGALLTADEVQKRKQAAGELKRSMQRWRSSLTAWRRGLESSDIEKQQAAKEQLAALDDLSVIPAYEALLADKESRQKGELFAREYVNFLTRMREPAATEALTRMAVTSPWPGVASAAVDSLKQRNWLEYVPMLMGNLRGPIMSESSIEEMPHGIMVYSRRYYREGADVDDLKIETVHFHPAPNIRTSLVKNPDEVARRIDRAWQKAKTDAANRDKQNEAAVKRENQDIDAANTRICGVLSQTTAASVETTPGAWWSWWREYNELQTTGTHPVRTQSFATVQESRPSSCFVRGTPVWTLSGIAPIESILAGDRVLAQDPLTGELAFKVVVAATVRPPSPTRKIIAGEEAIGTTLGHRFWNEGHGWQMAKHLETGANLKTLRGPVAIESIEDADLAPAFNLVVEDFHTYFVGQQGLLVHDVTAPKATAAAVPGLIPATTKATKTASLPREPAVAK